MSCAGSVVLIQTQPAAPYVCRTGNITLRCQYDGVENVLNVVWNVDGMVNLDFDSMTLPGHTALDRTESHQDLVIASFADLRGTYQCIVIQSTDITNSPHLIPGAVEGELHFVTHWYYNYPGYSRHVLPVVMLHHRLILQPLYSLLTLQFQMKTLLSLP